MSSLGEAFRQNGYARDFLYGGYGYFDNMNAFFESNGYTIAVYGDSRYKDIDVYVYRSTGPGVDDWTLVKRDNDDSSVAVVSITPESTEVYKILIKAYKYNEGYDVGHYGIVISHD